MSISAWPMILVIATDLINMEGLRRLDQFVYGVLNPVAADLIRTEELRRAGSSGNLRGGAFATDLINGKQDRPPGGGHAAGRGILRSGLQPRGARDAFEFKSRRAGPRLRMDGRPDGLDGARSDAESGDAAPAFDIPFVGVSSVALMRFFAVERGILIRQFHGPGPPIRCCSIFGPS